MKRAHWLAATFAAFALIGYAVAASAAGDELPHNLRNPEQYGRVGQPGWSHTASVATSEGFVRTSTGASNADYDHAKLFRFGALVNIRCDAAAWFCAVMEDSGPTLDANGYLADAASTGPRTEGVGGCFKVPAGHRDVTFFRSYFHRRSGDAVSIRTGSCQGTPDKMDGAPCDADADCHYSTSTCDTNTPPKGYFLIHEAAAATSCDIAVEQ